MVEKTTLTNGLRVLTERLEGTQSVTALVLVKAGSRWEHASINGISHFLEHMFFKGAHKYKDAKAVSEAIDGVGGDFNAFTSKEYAGYFVKVAARHRDIALDVLSDMLLHARFAQEEIEKERGVILEEFNMYQDTPMYQVAWNFERAMFGDQPLGWDEVGTKDVIRRLQREDFVDYKESLYTPENMVIALAGLVNHEEVVKKVEQLFPMESKKATREMLSFEAGLSTVKSIALQSKKTEQAHVVLGVPAYPEEHPDHYVLKVLSALLGGNMSSRMFLAVREAKGLAYYISCGMEDYLDTGTFYTRAGVDVNRSEAAVVAIMEEYKRIVEEPVSAGELKKGKEFLKGKLMLSLEDSEHVAQMHARNELLYGKLKSVEDISAGVDRVTEEDVHRVAQALFCEGRFHLALIGPYETEEPFLKLL